MRLINKKLPCLIFILALGARLAFVLFFPPLSAPDTGSYEEPALNLIRGNGYSSSPGVPTATRAPAYPFFLAGVYLLFGQSHMAVKIIQAILGAISCVIISSIGREVFNRKVGLWSGVAMALYPPLISTAGFILSEELTIFLLAISILFLIKAMKKRMISWYVLSGSFMGLVTLCRSVTFLFPFFLYFVLLFLPFKKRQFIQISIFMLFMTVTIAPWTIRNYIRFKAFLPIQTGGGLNFWMGTYLPSDGLLPYCKLWKYQ